LTVGCVDGKNEKEDEEAPFVHKERKGDYREISERMEEGIRKANNLFPQERSFDAMMCTPTSA